MAIDNNQLDLVDGGITSDEGLITISEEVITAIAASSASQVEGLGEKKSSVTEDISRIFGSRRSGITVNLDGDNVSISLKIAVKQGYPVHQVARKAQEKIQQDVGNQTGLKVTKVDVYVDKLQIPEEETETKKEAGKTEPLE